MIYLCKDQIPYTMPDLTLYIEYIKANSFILIAFIFFLSILTVYMNMLYKRTGLIISLFFYGAAFFCISFFVKCSVIQYLLFVVLPTLLLSVIGLLIFDKKNNNVRDPRFRVELLSESKKKYYLEDINNGVAIFGASGAGKTASAIFYLLKHFAANLFGGIIYDYKNGELTEVAYPLFKAMGIPVHIFNPTDVNRSVCVNPIDPSRLHNEADINSVVSTFVLNLSQSEDTTHSGKFFQEGAESLIAAVVWRLKKDYPEKCNFPFVTAFLLATENHHEKITTPEGVILEQPFKRLADWICKDVRAEILGSTFLSGLSNMKQTAALYSTLTAALRKIASPEIFYLLSKNELPLDLNADNNRSVLCVVNTPGTKETFLSPVLATVIDAAITQMGERHRKPSFVLLDEAPTVKIMNLARRIATLRSYGLSFVYCVQDKIQAVAQMGGKEYRAKEILTNLSTIFMGKTNDPDTAKFYEKYFEIIEREQLSVSKGKTDLLGAGDKGGTRVTTSKKDIRKVRDFEFFKLKAGEFFIFQSGTDKKFRFYYEKPEIEMPLPINEITPTMLEINYEKVLEEARNFLKK